MPIYSPAFPNYLDDFVKAMQKPQEDIVTRTISEQCSHVGFVPVPTIKELSKAIFPNVTVSSTSFQRYSLTRADVKLELHNGTFIIVHWERLFKATGEDGTLSTGNQANARFHETCDDKGATMTVFKVREKDGEERLLAG
jgi:hypothetical protein